jgi:spore germination cell wall hydrolase CwlJ-like protein
MEYFILLINLISIGNHNNVVDNSLKSANVLVLEKESLDCMTNALYKEAEIRVKEEDVSMVLIAQVVLNRKNDKRFPNTVCNVIKQKIKRYCIFSFYCLRGHDHMPDIRRYSIARIVAYNALQGHYTGITSALFFKRCEVKDKWFKKNTILLKQVRSHCFYTYRR